MGKAVTVEVLHTSVVKPASPSPQPFLSLSPCDLMWRDYTYNRRLLFYERPVSAVSGDDEYPRFIHTLRSSLPRVLASFYPFAGRLVELPAGAAGDGTKAQLAVACNDEGAELVEARIHGVSFLDLKSSNFDMQPYFVQLTRWASYTRLQEGAPLFSIQVTRFSCGSIAFGIAHSHVVADGFSLWHFMSSWVECVKGKPLSLEPSHDRTPLMVQSALPEKAIIDWIEDVKAPAGITTVASKVQHVVSFPKEMVEELKTRANNVYGSYEVLCAELWKKVSKPQLVACSRDARTSFCSVVNMRTRMEPPLAVGYFGCALLWGMASATLGELQDEELAATAARIRGAVRSCTSSHMQQFIHFLELYGKDAFVPKIAASPISLRVSSSPKFPMLSIDFGWGRPIAVRSVIVEENGKLVLYPGPSGLGSSDVCLSFPSGIMSCLHSDPSFPLYDPH
ncbi:hypothetical protein GOP47_0007180 [Adiantum capillus-veneris]|uniref:Uncharacterized protein n=2 Tax=Adiantum capillus-veneris TaxID=13818 RepID=A0A9D4V068_ADICA|nr:hypothetical protein GOP47_0007180 [Adiantum capillus-veneris]